MKASWLALLLMTFPAHAAVDQATLDQIAFAPAPGAQLPLDEPLSANGNATTLRMLLSGKPALLLPVDYRCRVTCGPALSIIGAAIEQLDLEAGGDYRLLLLGLNDDVTTAETAEFVASRVGPPALQAATMRLTAGPEVLATLTSALGYRYDFDATTQSFAHPLGAVTLTSSGAVSRLLSPLALDATDLRLALLDAGEGRIGTFAARLALLCYGFDAAHGLYTSRVILLLRAGAIAMMLSLGAWLLWLIRRHARAGAAS